MARQKANNAIVHRAGEYLVMAELISRGYPAYLAPTGMPGFDILISMGTDQKPRKLEVKTIKARGAWPCRNIRNKQADVLVPVILYEKGKPDNHPLVKSPFHECSRDSYFGVFPRPFADNFANYCNSERWFAKKGPRTKYANRWDIIGDPPEPRRAGRLMIAASRWYAAGQLCRVGYLGYLREGYDSSQSDCFFIDSMNGEDCEVPVYVWPVRGKTIDFARLRGNGRGFVAFITWRQRKLRSCRFVSLDRCQGAKEVRLIWSAVDFFYRTRNYNSFGYRPGPVVKPQRKMRLGSGSAGRVPRI